MTDDRTRSAVEAAYVAHADELVRYATAMVGPDRARDVVTDAFVSVIERDRLADVVHVRAYLFRAVYHRSIDANRSRDRRRRRDDRDERNRARLTVVDPPQSTQAAIDARKALAVLSDQQRAAVFLTYWCDLAPAEVADRLDVSEGTVKKQLARARTKLKEVLDV